MSTITLRSVKGSGLTNNEIDANFTNLNTDKLEATQTVTLTNKTLALGSNTISGTTAQFNTALTDGDFATLAGTETLTNKTLTAPVLANPSYSGATANGGTVTTIDINGGTIDGTVIGGTTPAAVSATTLSASGNVSTANGFGYLWGAGAVQIYSNGTYLRARTNSVDRLELTDAGLAVTGALSATTSVTGGTGSAGLVMRGYTGSSIYGALYRVGDTPSDTNAQLISNAVTTILNGTTSSTLAVGAVNVAVATASGLAVTGALSATGGLTVTGVVSSALAVGDNYTIIGSPTGNAASVKYNASGITKWQVGRGAATGSNNFEFYNNTASATALTLDASGNLGLGVTPSAWTATHKAIQIQGGGSVYNNGADGYINVASNSYYDGANWRYVKSSYATQYIQASGTHYWYTAPSGTAGNAITFTQAMTLDASGNLLVGATTGNFRLLAKRSTAGTVVGIWNTAEEATQIAFHNIAGGAVGSVTVTASTTAYNTTSDARLKENITDAIDASSLIDALQVRQFDWKSDGSHQRYGFVAQELYEVAPEAVCKPQDPDEMMAVDYSKLVPMLVKEIQSLRARVAQLEGI